MEYNDFKKQWDSNYINHNKQDKACFQQNMAYGDFENLSGLTASDEVLHD